MSVTFHPELGPIDHYRVQCLNCRATQRFDSSDAAFDFVRANDEGTAFIDGCVEDSCLCVGAVTSDAVEAAGEPPKVNMASANARHILGLLGLPTDGEMVGALSPADLLGRALIALAVAPADEGVPAHEVPGPGATLIHGGRGQGYSEALLTAIVEVTQWADTHGRDVVWA